MSPANRRRLAVGAAAGALYALVAVVTIRASDSHVRPLFEGIGPNTPYQWVNPPKAFAAGNVKPHANDSAVSLGPNGSPLAGAGSTDGQILLNLPEGAFPPHPPDDRVIVRLTPFDPGKLARPPDELRSNGNAYKVEFLYQPSGEAITAVAKPGNVILTVPEPAQGLLFSPDGQNWQKLESQGIGGVGTVGGPFTDAGFYLGATSSFTDPPGEGDGDSSGIGGIVVVGVLTVALAFLLGFGPALLRRLHRRRRRSETAAVRAARTQQARGRQRKKSKQKPKKHRSGG
ncbi:MAG TPA: hypothetical protein VM121_02055 [Acidimicrobiales bacterium]|nr:hypothetical protein [Acidimicrobiales bacterium]